MLRIAPLLAATALVAPMTAVAQESAPAAVTSAFERPLVTAHRVTEAPDIDGVLDEQFWSEIQPYDDFRQREPVDGAPATERTEVRVAYDENNLYFGLVMYDSEPDRIWARILHREGPIGLDDRVIVALDTYHDRRNAYIFEMNALGTQGDALMNDESLEHSDWNWEGIYRSEGRITDYGWVLEVAIPVTTIRFPPGDELTMGLAVYRSIRRKAEELTWPYIPQRFGSGIFQVSQYATLTGLNGLHRGRNLEVKPFGILGAQRVGVRDTTDFLDDFGLDVKYGLTSNLTLDLTWNTDFAQVESDNVQINLTRFNLFYPEKREFFLERAGLFTFGDLQETEIFFSRSIGLQSDIIGGGRVTGQQGKLSIGVLNLQTGDNDANGIAGANNGVARLRADLMPRMSVGGIFTNLQNAGIANRVAGADATLRFWGSSSIDAWVANVWADQLGDGTTAGSVTLRLQNRSYNAFVQALSIGESFQPALGFVARTDQRTLSGRAAWTPWFPGSNTFRQFQTDLQGSITEGQDRVKQSHLVSFNNVLRFQSGESMRVGVTNRFERLDAPFVIRERQIPVGDHSFNNFSWSLNSNPSRAISGSFGGSIGEFYFGDRLDLGLTLETRFSQLLALTGRISHSELSFPVADGDFDATTVSLGASAATSRKLFASALVQYDNFSEAIRANIRVNWIHTPGSDLFLVLDSAYFNGDLLDPSDTRWIQRTGVVKVTYLKAF